MVSPLSSGSSFVSNLWGGQVLGYVEPLGKIVVDNHGFTYQEIISQNHVSQRTLDHLLQDLSHNAQEQILKLTNGDKAAAKDYL